MYRIAVQTIEKTFNDIEFRTLQELEKYHFSVKDSSHYEVISGKQCLYFDFDGKESLDFTPLVNSLLKELGPPIKVLLFNSSDTVKFSYHVIVRGIYLQNHLDCGYLAKKIIELTDCEKIKKYFDSSVYTSRRNLRLVGSRKIDNLRIKKFDSVLFGDEKYAFAESLASNTTDGKLFEILERKVPEKNHLIIDTEWSSENLDIAQKFIEEYYAGIFSISQSKNFLNLKRERKGYCYSCCREHSAENSYIFKNKNGKMFFVCRRNNDKHIPIEDEEEVIYMFKKEPAISETPSAKDILLKKVKKLFPL